MRRASRLKIALNAAAAAVIVAAAGYGAYWLVMAHQLAAGVAHWESVERARGYDIVFDPPRVTGFPLRFRIVLTHGSLARGHPAAYRVTTPIVTGEATPFDLSRWRVGAPQGASGTVQGIDGTIIADSLRGLVRLDPDAYRAELTVERLRGQGAEAGELAASLTLPHKVPVSDRDIGLGATLQLFHLTLPQPVKPLGKTIESLLLDVTLKGGLPPGDWRTALTAWSANGGTVEVPRAALEWGKLDLQASGTLALDDNLQPEAALTASIVNHDALIDAAVTAHMLNRDSGVMVKLVLDLLAKRDADGRPRLTAPVTVQDRTLYIGKAKILKLPLIEWQ